MSKVPTSGNENATASSAHDTKHSMPALDTEIDINVPPALQQTTPPEPPKARIRAYIDPALVPTRILFLSLWDKAVGTPDYANKEWMELERRIAHLFHY
jgi:hypothetical protein